MNNTSENLLHDRHWARITITDCGKGRKRVVHTVAEGLGVRLRSSQVLLSRGIGESGRDNPVLALFVIDEVHLPLVREAIPEQTKHVGDNDSQEGHFDNIEDDSDIAVVSNLVISMRVVVAFLNLIKKAVLWDEV